MPRSISIGIQNFADLREHGSFYIDKTGLIKEWWESNDSVTLITRPRRFGKTFNMDMLRTFFSTEFVGRDDLFEGLSIWKEEKYHALQGTWPTIFITLAGMKPESYENAIIEFRNVLSNVYGNFRYLISSECLSENEKIYFQDVCDGKLSHNIYICINKLCDFLARYYKKKVIIVLDEYDTPMQEAYTKGYWDEIVGFMRSFFNATFKTNSYLHRAVMTGVTRVSKESIFSDFNHVVIAGIFSNRYAKYFGFTEEEVFVAMDEYGYTNKNEVKKWYDGFIIGQQKDIYNPWSIVNFLDTGEFDTYWANTSENSVVDKLIKEGDIDLKQQFEDLLEGREITALIDETIAYNYLSGECDVIWSLLVSTGYFRAERDGEFYKLMITNYETLKMFRKLVRRWVRSAGSKYNNFIKAMLLKDVKAMNKYMNDVALNIFSYFDTGSRASGEEPERFYHGFVLGLMVDLRDRFIITSNRESGFGRYDVILEPSDKIKDNAIIIEFKVYDSDDERNLQDTVAMALKQINDKRYEAILQEKGMLVENIYKYGFAFQGKKLLIGV